MTIVPLMVVALRMSVPAIPSAAATSSFDKMLRECVIWDA
jgi:hypothetical protein